MVQDYFISSRWSPLSTKNRLLAKQLPVESCTGCHFQSSGKCLAPPTTSLMLCMNDKHSIMAFSKCWRACNTRATLNLESKCITGFKSCGLLSGMVGRRQHYWRIGSCQIKLVKLTLFSTKLELPIGWIQGSLAKWFRAFQCIFGTEIIVREKII